MVCNKRRNKETLTQRAKGYSNSSKPVKGQYGKEEPGHHLTPPILVELEKVYVPVKGTQCAASPAVSILYIPPWIPACANIAATNFQVPLHGTELMSSRTL
ncbi:hypothetical protein CC2G_009634 [Coprinopsis cinerea AmutBmut pab1-1]|nr:hypothetical protein CC2G_009634 [Coprinopsis cinerea AmutBmut pab1-1]